MDADHTPIPLDGVSATFRNFGQNDTKRGRNAKSAAETPRAQQKRIGNFMIADSLRKFDPAQNLRSDIAVDSKRNGSVVTSQRDLHERSRIATAS